MPRLKPRNDVFAFTLAEVLITLGIIGVVAAMTLPSLIQNIKEKVMLSQFNAAYNLLENAYKMTMIDGTTYEDWNITITRDDNNSRFIYEKFKPFLSITDICDHKKGCAARNYKTLIGSSYGGLNFYNDINSVKLKLSNGMYMYIMDNTLDFGTVLIDTNGDKGPNKLGNDLFNFSFNKNYVVGGNTGTHDLQSWQKNFCNIEGAEGGWLQGLSCTHWIIRNKNMDYLHRNISAEWD